jgi:hypothetical protein
VLAGLLPWRGVASASEDCAIERLLCREKVCGAFPVSRGQWQAKARGAARAGANTRASQPLADRGVMEHLLNFEFKISLSFDD